ncbi:MAG: pyruvate kinase [bacterium]
MKKTKIVATIGPATRSIEMIEKLVDAGLNVARLNFSHDVCEEHGKSINYIRQVSQEKGQIIAIMQDLQGARVRTGVLPEEGIKISKGELIVLVDENDIKDINVQDKKIIPVTYKGLVKTVEVGHELYIQDKLIELITREVNDKYIVCESKRDGLILEHKGINFPHSHVDLPTITEKDKRDVKFGIEKQVDFIALSFVRSGEDVCELRNLIKEYAGKDADKFRIVVKIECLEAIKKFDEILSETDAVMVARGDLGIELPPEDIPFLQKDLIEKCVKAAKPVIVATHMLDSMINNLHPTRAEVSDVANAVIDHTDAVMLSGETANGKYPVESVEMMTKIIKKTESSAYKEAANYEETEFKCSESSICTAVSVAARSVDIKAILAMSSSGLIARTISKYRPKLPIFVATDNIKTANHLVMSWGVIPFNITMCDSVDELINRALDNLKNKEMINVDDKMIIVTGQPFAEFESLDSVRIHQVI